MRTNERVKCQLRLLEICRSEGATHYADRYRRESEWVPYDTLHVELLLMAIVMSFHLAQ